MLMLMVSVLMVLMLMISRLMARLITLMLMVLHDGANDANANGANGANANGANDANDANANDANANPLYSVCLEQSVIVLAPGTLWDNLSVLGQTVKVLTVRYLVGRAGALGQLASTVQCCPGEGWFADE